MIAADKFCSLLADHGVTRVTGVPCSYLAGPIEVLGRTPGRYVPAVNEGTALATAAGAALAGERCAVLLQNSGLGNLINPLTSLVMTYRLPVLIFVTLRGWPDERDDEPQHEVMGRSTHAMLTALGVAHWTLPEESDDAELEHALDEAELVLADGRPAVVLVAKGVAGKAEPAHSSVPAPQRLDSAEVIEIVAGLTTGHPVVATTGYTGRELFGVDDRPGNFYMQGSMGHASSVGLGMALARTEQTVVVLDGDGAALMHLGALSTIGAMAPTNLVHLVLDNGLHESTGGQRSTSDTTSIEAVAFASGYATAVRCSDPDAVRRHLRHALDRPGPHMLVVPTLARGGRTIAPRATSAHPPTDIRDRVMRTLSGPPGVVASPALTD